MDILLYGEGKRFTFPSLPESIKVYSGTSYQEYSIISKGNFVFPKGMKPTEVSWSGVFFGPSKKNESYIVKTNTYHTPDECDRVLGEWQQKGTHLKLMVVGAGINIDVTLAEYTSEPTGGYGNKSYEIAFKQYRDLKIYTTSELKIARPVKKTQPRTPSPAAPQPSSNKGTYTVKTGDCLWRIAQKYYGNGAQWTKIRDANMSVIQAGANKYNHGNTMGGTLIHTGDVLTIPN